MAQEIIIDALIRSGFENDAEMRAEPGIAPMRFEQWLEPFNTGYRVPSYARSA